MVGAPGFKPDEVLRLAASLDQGSGHPLAEKIVRAAKAKNMVLSTPENFDSGSDIGLRGRSAANKLHWATPI